MKSLGERKKSGRFSVSDRCIFGASIACND